MAKSTKIKIEKTPWCKGKKALKQLERLKLDIKSNGGDSSTRKKKLEYVEELRQFIMLINVSRGEKVRFRFSANTGAMAKCMMEMNILFGENKLQVEDCALVPKKYVDKICVLKVDGKTLVLIELE